MDTIVQQNAVQAAAKAPKSDKMEQARELVRLFWKPVLVTAAIVAAICLGIPALLPHKRAWWQVW
jgi:hypothetical protein